MGVNSGDDIISRRRLPPWLKRQINPTENTRSIKISLRSRALNTVCEEAKCPNICECFERGTATIMIMGNICTRRCGFCHVLSGVPKPIDGDEPARVAEQVREMRLSHAVITSVTRDDIPDGGAAHFAKTIEAIRKLNPQTTIEILTPDFLGREECIRTVCRATPDIFDHNLETVERLTPYVRSDAQYRRSLSVLGIARKHLPEGFIKSGIMVGLGETYEEVERTLEELSDAGCDIVTIGQYLPPSKDATPVAEYISPNAFQKYEALGLCLGFKYVLSGPLVRSSYLADKALLEPAS